MSYLIIPKGYKSALTPEETERGIKLVKDFFQQSLSKALKLRRVTAPLFVLQGQGINDDLSGVERAVSFPVKDLD
ncbi:MAG: aspartate--ammonia ligase, partial [Bacteroidales bacterium]|nr:aspartate--ammonia ligase [Bacteroidales bacterium]